MSGIDVLKLLRSRGITTPVIVISGRTDMDLEVLVKNLGAMAILRKPPDNYELIELIKRAASQAGC
ncbi:MAG TPA: response regulator, partial [Rhizomicrobium sp.]|nr:response regulator [Rhizomicrobium sp.]